MVLLRKLLGLMALFCCAISLAAPSSTRSLHLVNHVSAPVAVGEFHSHAEFGILGDAGAANQDTPVAPDGGGQDKSGHSHMPSSVSDVSQLPESQFGPRHLVSDDSHAAADLPSLTNRGWSPPVRPPKSA